MQPLVIATQLPKQFNDALRDLATDVELVELPPGSLFPPPSVRAMLVGPPVQSPLPAVAPEGWPFDLQWIQLASSGVDAYPAWIFQVPLVTTARGANALPVAEFALAAVVAQAKQLPKLWIDEASQWQATRTSFTSSMLHGAVLGVFGFGAIGQALAVRAHALGMKVLAARQSGNTIAIAGVEGVGGIIDLMQRCDHLVLAAALTSTTYHIVNRQSLAAAKHGLHLVNVARGELIDDTALLEALDIGVIGHATLDVTAPEPLPEEHRFYRHPKVRISPHVAQRAHGTPERLARRIVDNITRFRNGELLREVLLVADSTMMLGESHLSDKQ